MPQIIATTLLVIIPSALTGYVAYAWQHNRVQDAQHALEQVAARADRQQLAFERNARQVEQFYTRQMDAAAQRYEEEKKRVEDNHRRVVDDLRTGATRLRDEWQGCKTAAELSRTTAASAHADELAKLRAQSAADLVRLGAECDAQIRGLQAVIQAGRAP